MAHHPNNEQFPIDPRAVRALFPFQFSPDLPGEALRLRRSDGSILALVTFAQFTAPHWMNAPTVELYALGKYNAALKVLGDATINDFSDSIIEGFRKISAKGSAFCSAVRGPAFDGASADVMNSDPCFRIEENMLCVILPSVAYECDCGLCVRHFFEVKQLLGLSSSSNLEAFCLNNLFL